MSGIVGCILPLPCNGRPVGFDRMLGALPCDGESRSGRFVHNSLGLAIGWVCDAGTYSDCLPVWNERKDICLVFMGEHFLADIGSRLSNGSRSLENEESARSLINLYQAEGERFYERLNGWFSGLVVDLRRATVTLFNDRYGLSRIYYHESRDGFYFASKAKCLLEARPWLRALDQQGLAEFVSTGCVLQNRSLFKDISILPGAARWTVCRDGRIDKRRYFTPERWEQQEKLEPSAFAERLKEVLGRVVPRYLGGGRTVGMSLTGGLDSRMILAWAKAPPGSLPCYTFGGPFRDCADVRIARRLARVSEQPHTTLPLRKDFFNAFPSLAEQTIDCTDGAMDVSGAVELHINQLAREIAPVRLTGNYGSEILRSNVAFRPGRVDTSVFIPEFGRLVEQAGETYRHEAVGNRLSFIAFKQVPWHHYSRLALEQSQLTLRSPFLDNELVALAYRAPAGQEFSPQPLLEAIEAGNPALCRVRTDRGIDRRPRPLLSTAANKWQEFTAKAEYAYDYGMPDWLARVDQAVKPLRLERFFLGRHKFYHFRVWYRDQLREHLLACGKNTGSIPGCYRPDAARRMVDDHLAGRANHTLALHKLLSIQLIEQRLVRSS